MAILSVVIAAARAQDRPSGIRHFEPVTVLAGLGEAGAQGGTGALGRTLSFDAFGRRFDLDIEPNDQFASGSTVWLDAGGSAVVSAPELRLYKGRLRGAADSWVRAALINGALHAMIWTPDEVFTLQPRDEFDGSGSTEPVAYRRSDMDSSLLPPARCGVEGDAAHMGVPEELVARRDDGGSGQSSTPLEAAVVVVADYEYYGEAGHGAESDADLRYLMSVVDAIYEREVDISLHVPSTIIFTSAQDPFSSTITPGRLLNELSAFRSVPRYCATRTIKYCSTNTTLSCVSNANCPSGGTCRTNSCTSDAQCGAQGPCVTNLAYGSDLTHLVTNRNLSDSTIGIAWIGAVCSGYYGAGLSQEFTTSTFTMSLLLAHEIGHNFNALHDPSSDPCGDPYPRYIMQACLSSAVIDEFSTASKNAIIPYSQNLSCLSAPVTPAATSTPTATFTAAPPTTTPIRSATGTPTHTPTHTLSATATRTSTILPSATPVSGPPALSGLVLWLDASQLTGLFTGAPVGTWPDLSGAVHHALQSINVNRPTYLANGINGNPVVRFDGVDDYLSVTGAVVNGSTARTVFVVARPTVAGNKGFVDLGSGTTTGTAFMLTPEYGVRVLGGNRFWSPAATLGTAALYVVQFSGNTTNDLSAWLNGSALALSGTLTATIQTSGSGTIGSWTAAPVSAHSYDGDLAEIVVYNRALTTAERRELEQYLSAKYGLVWQGGGTPTATATVPAFATATPTRTPTAFASPSPTPSNPGTIAGLVLWLDAHNLTGLNEGTPVSTWGDASGLNHHATQGDIGQQPTFRATAMNGEPAVRFDGANDSLAVAGAVVSGAQPRTVFFVARPGVIGNRSIIDLGNGLTVGGGFQISPEFAVRVSGANRVWAPAASTTAATLGVVRLSGTTTSTLELWIDGVARAATSTVLGTIGTTGSGTVGRWTAGGNFFDGDIAEIIAYSRALSAGERQTIEQYLTGKYRLGEISGPQLRLDASQLTGISPGAPVSSWPASSAWGTPPR